MQNNKTLCLTLGFLLLLQAGFCETSDVEAGLSFYSCFNPDGDILAVFVGFKSKGHDHPAALETRPVLLRLNGQSLLESIQPLGDWVIRDMAWRPVHGSQLYYVTYDKIPDSDGHVYEPISQKWFRRAAGRFVMFDSDSGDHSSTTVSENSLYNHFYRFRWSPNGKMLAGSMKQSNQAYGELVVSFDGGKTFKRTEIEMYGWPVWINDEELYLGATDNTILKVLRDGQGFIVKEELTKEFGIGLRGSFQGKSVYLAWPCKNDKGEDVNHTRRLFVGDTLIYETEDQCPKVFVFSGNIVIEADEKVVIFDEDLSMCHEKILAQKTHLLNFQPDTNTVFLAHDWKTILCYDYTHKERPRVLFSVDMLSKSSK